ncbi:hypothetical protein [Actinoallomurus sp. CA-142502]|uniref:hypothetical protein n=1 Tax=Actinoallomurus sp. CA-142502 TaxID=3239885 RepID=UPI003D8E8BB3
MADIEDILGSAELPQKTVELCLKGNLQADFEVLERQLREAEETDDDALAGGVRARELAEQIEDVRRKMAEHVTMFRFTALGAKSYSDLLAKHPPTEEQKQAGAGVNLDTWPAALVAACALDPKMTVEQAERLHDKITDGQWEELYDTALACNRKKVDVPFSFAASAIRASSAPRPSQPEPGAFPAAGSSGGSLAG